MRSKKYGTTDRQRKDTCERKNTDERKFPNERRETKFGEKRENLKVLRLSCGRSDVRFRLDVLPRLAPANGVLYTPGHTAKHY